LTRINIDTVMSWDPCYEQERIKELFAGRDFLSVEDILALDIPPEDRFWALARTHFTTERVLRLTACRCAERALSTAKDPDPRSIHAVEVAKRYAEGTATKLELASAAWEAEAAWGEAEAAWGAVRGEAAWAEARAADEASAWAAWSVAEESAWAEARVATDWSAAMTAAWNTALDDLCELAGWMSAEEAAWAEAGRKTF
jgi:hypothetical protein